MASRSLPGGQRPALCAVLLRALIAFFQGQYTSIKNMEVVDQDVCKKRPEESL